MKSITSIAVLLILFCAYFVPAEAQEEYLTVFCDDCRDTRINARDYRNFAYNQVFGPDGDMTYDEADFFRIVNPEGQSVFVDMNMDIGLILADVGLPVPVPLATVVSVQVILIYENGDQEAYRIDPRAHPNGLPVGGRSGRGAGGGGGAGPGGRGPGGGGAGAGAGSGSGGSTRICGITRVDGGRGRRTCIWR